MEGTIVTLNEHLDKSVASRTATGVLTRVFFELDRLAHTSEPDDAWAQQLVDLYTFSNSVEIGFLHAKAFILAILKPNWDSLSLEFRKRYGYSWVNFARLYTGGKELSTINNYVNVANVWFLDKVAPPGPIEINIRGEDGRPLLQAGRPEKMRVEFNPFMVPMSKLLVVTARAANEEMTPRLWEMLADPFFSYEDLRQEHTDTASKSKYTISFFVEGPGLFAQLDGQTRCIAEELNWDGYNEDATTTRAFDMFLKRLQIQADEERIYDIERKGLLDGDSQ